MHEEPEDVREYAVVQLATTRRRLLEKTRTGQVRQDPSVAERLLATFYSSKPARQLERVSDGIVDPFGVPGWDCWVHFFVDRTSDKPAESSFLISLIPDAWVDRVDAATTKRVSSRFVSWLDDVNSDFAQSLRESGGAS